jgi:hypothetical protein
MDDDLTTDDRNNGPDTGRDHRGRFASGNPGRPQGARHRSTRAAEALLDGEAEALTRRVIEAALGGDMQALRICMERILPPAKGRPVHLELPALKTASDGAMALDIVVQAVGTGALTPEEGNSVATLVAEHRKQLEATEFEQRLARLEAMANGNGGSVG